MCRRLGTRKGLQAVWITGSLIALVLGGVTIQEVRAAEYQIQGNRPVAQVLRPEVITGPHYQVQDPVVAYDYESHYTVTSDYGSFEVIGDSALRKLIREIHAIASLREVKKSKVYLASLTKAGAAPVHLGKNLITHPVDTVTGVPKGVMTLFGNVGKGITTMVTGGTDPSEDNRAKQVLQVSSYKREWAYKLGVDPYTSNRVLQKELNSLGWAGALGSLTVSVVALPATGPAMTALKMARLADQMTELAEQRDDFGARINKMVEELPPARMRLDNEEKLSAMGISKELATLYLDHPDFTPRHDAVIVESLYTLKEATGRELFLQLALAASSEAEADFVMNTAQTLRGYQLTTAPIRTIQLVPPFVMTTTAKGTTLVAFPIDHGVWSVRAERAVRMLQKAAGEGSSLELWLTGTLSPLAREQLKQRGIVVRENIDTQIAFID